MENRKFILSAIYWHELSGKLDTLRIEDVLNEHINLSDYGSGVERIHFTFMAVRPSNTIHENEARYDRKTKTIEMALKLSYEHVVAADEDGVWEMMWGLFVVGIDLYGGMGVVGFDVDLFRDEVKKIVGAL